MHEIPRETKRAALAGQTSPLWWLYTVALTAAFLAFALLLWRAGLRRYESASS